ncbi:MAG: immune inhibitor A [Saprospiraceae bacterium]|nr:immune inhibitor A [Saprospiraceae bacterium]
MRSQLLVISVLLLFIIFPSNAQTHWHKLRIPLQGKSIQDLQKTGLAFDHGLYKPGEEFIGDFTHDEFDNLVQHGFFPEIVPNQILIESRTADPCDSFLINPPVYKLPVEYLFGSMSGFPTLVEIYESLDLMSELYPNLISKKNRIASFLTQEGRPIYYVKISDNPAIDEPEPEILYTALHHAREPISMSQMLYYMWYLLENYNKDPEVKRLVDSRAMYFVPCVNPDGYFYNQTTNPSGNGFWRKNRKNLNDGIGVDLNRNYGFEWAFNDEGSSADSDSEVFRGTSAFSEVETQAVKYFCESRNFKIAMNYHSHGNILIVPWGYNNLPTQDSIAYMAMARQFTLYNKFRVGTTYNTLNYEVNGVSDDWMYGDQKIFAFTPEVGYAFWPDRRDITRLNESTQYMNFMSAWNAGACAQIFDVSPTVLENRDGNLDILVRRTGLEDELINLQANIDQSQLFTMNLPPAFKMSAGADQILHIPFQWSPIAKYGDQVHIQLSLQTGDYIQKIDLDKVYLGNPIWEENCDNMSQWISSGGPSLSTTSESFTSSPSSFTDSPLSEIKESREIKMRTQTSIDLTSAREAKLSFRAKWDLDPEVDFAQIKISEDGVSYFPLCGQYTVLGSSFQDLDKPVYTGLQNYWISEYLDLKPWIGKKIFLQLFVATNFSPNKRDGFYIDDIRIYSDLINGSNELTSNDFPFTIYPQPALDQITMNGETKTGDQFYIMGLDGLRTKLKINNQSTDQYQLELPTLPTGLYFIQLIRGDGETLIHKLTIR